MNPYTLYPIPFTLTTTTPILIFTFILGICIGSFLNMLIDRIPREEQIVSGRSKCDSCRHVLSLIDLIPVVSWVLLWGRCRYCHSPIPYRNTIVELLTGILVTSILYYHTGALLSGDIYSFIVVIADIVIVSILIAITVIDLEHMIIPDVLLMVAGIATVIYILAAGLTYDFPVHIYSAVSSGLFFLILVVVTKGRGMGLGDVKYGVFMGLLLGFPEIVYGLYAAFLTGAIVSVMLILKRKKRFGQTIPFGPFLVIGTLLAHFTLLEPLARMIIPR